MTNLNIVQIIISVLLVVAILLQQRGTGLSSTFGGDSGVYQTKRGFEKVLFFGTIILSTLFLVISFVSFISPQ